MQYKILNIITLFLLLTLLSCKKKESIKLEHIESICYTIDSIHLNVKDIQTFRIINFKEKPSVFYFNNSDSSINIHIIDSKKDSTKIEKYFLKNVLKKSILDSHTKWLLTNKDTIFAISMNNKKIYMFNAYDQILDSFPLYLPDKEPDYVCFSSSTSCMKYCRGNLVIPSSSSVVFNQDKQEYYEMSGIIINILDKSITKFGRYSKSKIYNNTSYTEPYDRFDVYGNKILFSSEEDHKIYEYNIDTKRYNVINCHSRYIDSIPVFPDSCAFNRNAKINYTIQEARYGMLRYSKYDNKYYRLVKHKIKTPENTGLYKQEMQKAKYSLIIMDSAFNIIAEPVLKDKNSFNFILPINKGLIFSSSESTLKKNSTLCIDLLKLSKLH